LRRRSRPNGQRRAAGAQRYYEFKRRCVFCDIIRQETRLTRERLVFENDAFVVISPFAARVPYETWIIPKQHNCDFVGIAESEYAGLAQALKHTLQQMHRLLNDPPFNYLIHTAPFRRPRAGYWSTISQDYHWHWRSSPPHRPAGFEEGSGFYINPVSPEDAAVKLRAGENEELPEVGETPAQGSMPATDSTMRVG